MSKHFAPIQTYFLPETDTGIESKGKYKVWTDRVPFFLYPPFITKIFLVYIKGLEKSV
jgi:hypothetical protein